MYRRRTDRSLPVDLPRFHTDYAIRQRILGKVLKGKKKETASGFHWLRPLISFAAAAIILVIIIYSLTDFLPVLTGGSDDVRLAAHWQQVAEQNQVAEAGYVAVLEMDVFPEGFHYEAVIIAGVPGHWREFHLNWDGELTFTAKDHTEWDVGELPATDLLGRLDRLDFKSLLQGAGYPATISIAAGSSPATYTGEEQYLVKIERGVTHLISLEDQLAELAAPHAILTAGRPGNKTTYYLALESDQAVLHSAADIEQLARLTAGASKIHSFYRLEEGWLLDARVPGGQGLVWLMDNGVVMIKHWERVQEEVNAATGLNLTGLRFSRGLLTGYASVRGSRQQFKLNHEYDYQYRPVDLVLAEEGEGRVYHATFSELFLTDSSSTRQLWQVPRGSIVGLRGLDRHVVVESEEGGVPYLTLVDSDEGKVVARYEDLRLQAVAFSPDGSELLHLEPGRGEEASPLLWAAWSPDSARVVFQDKAGDIYMQSESQLEQLPWGGEQVTEARWLDSESMVLVCADCVRFHNFSTGESSKIMDLPGQSLAGLSAGEGRVALALGQEGKGTIHLWQPGGELRQVVEIAAEEREFVAGFSYSGSLLLFRIGQDRSRVMVLDPSNGRMDAIYVDAATPIWLSSRQLLLADGRASEVFHPHGK